MVLMYAVAFKAWLLGALEFSTVPTTRAQAPEVPVCGWWAKGEDDGALGTKKGFRFVVCAPCLLGWALGTNKLLSHAHVSLKIK